MRSWLKDGYDAFILNHVNAAIYNAFKKSERKLAEGKQYTCVNKTFPLGNDSNLKIKVQVIINLYDSELRQWDTVPKVGWVTFSIVGLLGRTDRTLKDAIDEMVTSAFEKQILTPQAQNAEQKNQRHPRVSVYATDYAGGDHTFFHSVFRHTDGHNKRNGLCKRCVFCSGFCIVKHTHMCAYCGKWWTDITGPANGAVSSYPVLDFCSNQCKQESVIHVFTISALKLKIATPYVSVYAKSYARNSIYG